MLEALHLTPPTMRCAQVSLTVHSPLISKMSLMTLFPTVSHKHYASSSFTVPKWMLCCSLHQNIPFICSELPRVHCSLPDPQPFPLPLYDLLVARQFRRDEMEGGMQLWCCSFWTGPSEKVLTAALQRVGCTHTHTLSFKCVVWGRPAAVRTVLGVWVNNMLTVFVVCKSSKHICRYSFAQYMRGLWVPVRSLDTFDRMVLFKKF